MPSSFDLAGKAAIITGAASGIGAATARRFAAAGASLVLAHYAPDGHDIDAVVEDVRAAGARAVVLNVNVRDPKSGARLVEVALSKFGVVDIAIANAAVARISPLSKMSEDEFAQTIDVDLTSVWRLFRAAVGPMSDAGWGRLLATSSTVGTIEAWNAHAHYAAAKAGFAGMVRSLASELGPSGITVNAIAPGIIETPQTLDEVNSLGPDGVALTARWGPFDVSVAPTT